MDASTSASAFPEIKVPEGYTLHTENNAHILLPASNEAFINPIQEFNRDLSVACIRVWAEEMNREREARFVKSQERKAANKAKGGNKRVKLADGEAAPVESPAEPEQKAETEPKAFKPREITILEALSATGLRAIRYAKEIPQVKYVIANDLSSLAVDAMRRNIEINGLAPPPDAPTGGKIRLNEGDACTLMYNHREDNKRVDVVDLDPYGTAAPFIDAAVQAVSEGGLLCVTCTDMPVLGTVNYPEKCFSNYGGVSVKAEYCHEAALRLVLHAVSTSASRYGKYIEPVVSLSIDFYVRLFIRVKSSPTEVKKAVTKTSHYYVCTSCASHYEQPLGKLKENKHEASGNVNHLVRTHAGPPVGDKCPECESALHLAGPMWSGPIHNTEFVTKVLAHLAENEKNYGTAPRMKGMLTVASEELNTPFYFTPSKIASLFHCVTPSLTEIASALLHAGHKISRSHASSGSVKTTASRREVHDVYRSWTKTHPVKMDKIAENSPSRKLLAREPEREANFARHPAANMVSNAKLVRYQQNPTSYWGPGSRAPGGAKGGKRKRAEDEA